MVESLSRPLAETIHTYLLVLQARSWVFFSFLQAVWVKRIFSPAYMSFGHVLRMTHFLPPSLCVEFYIAADAGQSDVSCESAPHLFWHRPADRMWARRRRRWFHFGWFIASISPSCLGYQLPVSRWNRRNRLYFKQSPLFLWIVSSEGRAHTRWERWKVKMGRWVSGRCYPALYIYSVGGSVGCKGSLLHCGVWATLRLSGIRKKRYIEMWSAAGPVVVVFTQRPVCVYTFLFLHAKPQKAGWRAMWCHPLSSAVHGRAGARSCRAGVGWAQILEAGTGWEQGLAMGGGEGVEGVLGITAHCSRGIKAKQPVRKHNGKTLSGGVAYGADNAARWGRKENPVYRPTDKLNRVTF